MRYILARLISYSSDIRCQVSRVTIPDQELKAEEDVARLYYFAPLSLDATTHRSIFKTLIQTNPDRVARSEF